MKMTTVNTAAKAIKGARTAKSADTRGPKKGSAMTNQSSTGYAAGELTGKKPSDTISTVKNTTSGAPHTVVSAAGMPDVLIPQGRFTGELAKLAKVGASYKALAAAWAAAKANPPAAKLARGVDAQNSPHTAKAIADAKRAGAKHDPVAKALAGKMHTPKAEKPAKAAKTTEAKPTADRTYKPTKKADTSKPDSFRTYMISTIRAHKSTNAAKAAHAASGKFSHERLNFKWAETNGYISDLK